MVNARVDHIGIIPAGGQKLQTVADLSRHVFNFQSDAGFFLQHQIDIAVGNLVLAPSSVDTQYPEGYRLLLAFRLLILSLLRLTTPGGKQQKRAQQSRGKSSDSHISASFPFDYLLLSL